MWHLPDRELPSRTGEIPFLYIPSYNHPAGDLLRAEQTRPDSQYGEMISKYIREGLIVPMEVTVKVRNSSHFHNAPSFAWLPYHHSIILIFNTNHPCFLIIAGLSSPISFSRTPCLPLQPLLLNSPRDRLWLKLGQTVTVVSWLMVSLERWIKP